MERISGNWRLCCLTKIARWSMNLRKSRCLVSFLIFDTQYLVPRHILNLAKLTSVSVDCPVPRERVAAGTPLIPNKNRKILTIELAIWTGAIVGEDPGSSCCGTDGQSTGGQGSGAEDFDREAGRGYSKGSFCFLIMSSS